MTKAYLTVQTSPFILEDRVHHATIEVSDIAPDKAAADIAKFLSRVHNRTITVLECGSSAGKLSVKLTHGKMVWRIVAFVT